MYKKKLMPLAAVILMFGSMFAVAPVVADHANNHSTQSWSNDMNQASYWGVDCEKVFDGDAATYDLSQLVDKMIIKAGSTFVDIYENPELGSYTHTGQNSVSWVILCGERDAVQEPRIASFTVEKVVEGMVPEGEFGFEWSCGKHNQGSFNLMDGQSEKVDINLKKWQSYVWCTVTEVQTLGADEVKSVAYSEIVGDKTSDESITFLLGKGSNRSIVFTNMFEASEPELESATFDVTKTVVGDQPVAPFEFTWACNGEGDTFTLSHGDTSDVVTVEFEAGESADCEVTETNTRGADTVSNNRGDGTLASFTLEAGEEVNVVFTNTFDPAVLGNGDDDEEEPREEGDVLGAVGQVDAPVGAVLAGGGGGAASSSLSAFFGLLASLGLVGAGFLTRKWTV